MEGVKNAMAKLTLRWPTIATTRPVLISAHPWHSRRRDDSTRSVVSSFRGGLIKLKRPGLLTRVGAPWFVVRTLDLSDFRVGQSQSTERLQKRPLENTRFLERDLRLQRRLRLEFVDHSVNAVVPT